MKNADVSCAFCRASARPGVSLKRCGGCKQVQYCSTACQKKHWKAQHKHECKQTVAEPVTPSPKEKACESSSCPGDASKKLQLCSACKCVYYCSKECQSKHYKKHKALCNSARSCLEDLGDPEKVKKSKCQRKYMERVVQRLQREAAEGDVGAQYNLGVCYEKGRGVAQDFKKAVKYYSMAAAQDCTQAKSALLDKKFVNM